MISMKTEYGFNSHLGLRVLANLQKYFKDINKIPKLEELCVGQYLWVEVDTMSPQQLAEDDELSRGHAIVYAKGVGLCATYLLIIIYTTAALFLNLNWKFTAIDR